MKHKITSASAAFMAILVLLIVGLISMSEVVPIEQQKDFENISNIVMFAVAVVGFFLPDALLSSNEKKNLSAVCSDIAVSGISFLMNIYVFGHEIQLEQFCESIKGWHLWWIICIILQILLLTGLGKELFDQIKLFFEVLRAIARELGNLGSDIWSTIRKCNQRMLLAVFVGFIFWSIYWGTLCHRSSVQAVFSDIDFWEKSALLWLRYLSVVFLLCILKLVLQKVKKLILGTNGTAAVGIVLLIVFAVLLLWIPLLLQIVEGILLIPVVTTATLWTAIRKIYLNRKDEGSDSNDFPDINKRDAVVVLFLFILIPLVIIFGGAFFLNDGGNIIEQDPTSITAWLEFLKVVADVAKVLLEYFI